jgi:hypothetical protein
MSILSRLFGKPDPQPDPQVDFARHMPVLADAAHNITLGIYWRLSRVYEKKKKRVDPHDLAYAVVYELTQNEKGKQTLGDFSTKHQDLIRREAIKAVEDQEIRHALSLEYAGRLMALAWNSGSPSSEEYTTKANIVTEAASRLGIEIANIITLWGPKAIVNLHAFAKNFRHEGV